MNCGAQLFDTNTQAIETSPNQAARNFLIHEIEQEGSPLNLHGLYLKAKADGIAQQATAFVQVYEAAHAAVADESLRLRRDDQLLCASIAFLRMFDVACNHAYSLSEEERNQLETSEAISELFSHLHTHFPHVDDAKRKNQLRNYVVYSHPARARCSDRCGKGRCTGQAGILCRKSGNTLALVRSLNHPDTSFQTALDAVRTYLGKGPGTAVSHVIRRHTSHAAGVDEFMAGSSDKCVGCEGRLSRWLHQFRSLHLKTRDGYTNTDRAQFIASAAQRCPRMLQICEVIMQHGGVRMQLGPKPQDRHVFHSVDDLPEVCVRAVTQPPQIIPALSLHMIAIAL
jgi:hypothetical protein